MTPAVVQEQEKFTKTPKDLVDIVGLSLRTIHLILSDDSIFFGVKVRYRRTRGKTGTYQISDESYNKLIKSQQRR